MVIVYVITYQPKSTRSLRGDTAHPKILKTLTPEKYTTSKFSSPNTGCSGLLKKKNPMAISGYP